MPIVEIRFTRKVIFHKRLKVSKKLADRLLALDGEDLDQGHEIVWSEGECSDDFTLIAEDLTDFSDVLDSENELTDLSVNLIEKKPKAKKESKRK